VPFAIFTRALPDEAEAEAHKASEATTSVQRASILSMKRPPETFIVGIEAETKGIVLRLKGPSSKKCLSRRNAANAAKKRRVSIVPERIHLLFAAVAAFRRERLSPQFPL
jgi:hypothetical protein